ncbi:hypothetical protein Tco_1345944 [Tanacetum coccineum]
MATLTFSDTHNMVTFLEKPAESDGIYEIIDFMNANQIHYALIVNPTIYTPCIEQFWATTKIKTVNGERQLQALVVKKKVIITETSIRSDLHLEDTGGIDCLPTATIFEELARIGAKTTTWKEFSSTMASAIICLATNQKFNMSKYIFDAMVKYLEGGVKFLMYPRFVQVFINQQLGDMSHHKKIYVNLSHTKKIFANMKREGKDFSGRVTPLFATMMIQANQEEGVDSVPHPSNSTADVPNEEFVPTHSNDPLLSGEDRLKLTELMDMCTKLTERVLNLEHTKTTQAQEITNLKLRVKKVVKSKEGTEESSKRTEDELESDKSKKEESSEQKAKGSRKKSLDEHEEAEEDDEAKMKMHMEEVQDERKLPIDALLSRKVGIIRSFGFLGVCKRTKIPFVCEYGLAIEWNSEDLSELLEGESDEFVLNHEGDKNEAGVISLKSDLTIKVQNKTRDNWLINCVETIETYDRKTTIDVIRCVVKLINNSTFMNTSIFDRFVEVCDSRRNVGCLGYSGNVRTGTRVVKCREDVKCSEVVKCKEVVK